MHQGQHMGQYQLVTFEACEACSLITAAQNDLHHCTFFQSPLPTPQTTLLPDLLSHKYPQPLVFRRRGFAFFLSPRLAALQLNPLLQMSASTFGLAACGAKGTWYANSTLLANSC